MKTPNRDPIRPALRMAFSAALLLAGNVAGQAAAAQDLVIDKVTVVDTRTGKLARNRAIVIDNGRIVRVVRAGSVKGQARTIDAGGKFAVPGYLDMHAHPLTSTSPATSLPLMVANGITGYRQMGGDPGLLAARRAGTLAVPRIAPALLAMPGMVMAGPLAADPQAAAAEVRKQKAEGADFIKVVDLGPDAFFAVLDTARELGLPVAGHQPASVDVRAAVARGMHAIEHLGPNAAMFEACSTDEAAIRQAYGKVATKGGNIKFDLPPEALKRLTANPQLLVDEAGFRQLRHVLDTYDEAKCVALAKTLARSGSWQVPTLIRLRAMELGNDSAFREDPNLRYITADDRQMWLQVGDSFSTRLSAESRDTLRQLYARQLKLVKLLDRSGVDMMVGTDFGGQWLVPGFSIHQEFDLLGEAGLSPLRILQMTTLNGARFLGREATMGTVEAGKDANLVLLDANPIAAVANLHGIDAVVLAGTYYGRGDLDAIKRAAEQP